jgi:hypothetical protein
MERAAWELEKKRLNKNNNSKQTKMEAKKKALEAYAELLTTLRVVENEKLTDDGNDDNATIEDSDQGGTDSIEDEGKDEEDED